MTEAQDDRDTAADEREGAANERDDVVRQYEAQRNTRLLQIMMGLVGIAVLVGINLWYSHHVQVEAQRVADQRWCALMSGLDDRYQALPKGVSREADKFSEQVHTLRIKLHCPPTVVVSPLPSAVPSTPASSAPRRSSVGSGVPTSEMPTPATSAGDGPTS